VIEEAERAIAGEGRQPQRQPRKLHRHRIQVDAVQTSFGHGSADRGTLIHGAIGDFTKAKEALEEIVGPDDLVLLMGAGDIKKLGDDLAHKN